MFSFYQKNSPQAEELRAYVEFELNKLERGLFLLNIVIAAAPLVGLLGTVSGLMRVFSGFMSGTEMSNEALANGIALALTTTALGLIIAVPSIIINVTINRKLDKIHSAVNILTERLIGLSDVDEK
ncbi:MAG: MotA/TolQ/ExbB proton channel family protein [Opitutales bacterium]|nr:MotA/TolQ/ExbB proton channel family protein [Opitutales bacterium]